METAVPDLPTLAYDQRPVWYRRWRWGRILLRFGLGAVALIFLIWGRPITRHGALLYHQQKCLTFSPPQTQVVFDEHPEASAALLAKGDEYQAFVPVHPFSRAAVTYSPKCWDEFQKLAFGAASPRRHVLFLHEVQTKTGESRLVCVWLDCEGKFKLDGIVIDPAGIATGPVVVAPTSQGAAGRLRRLMGSGPREGYMRFYAGQMYRDDPTRFYITYQLHMKNGTIQGWLSDDGTRVVFDYPQDADWRADGYFNREQWNAIRNRFKEQLPPSPDLDVGGSGLNRFRPAEFDLPEKRE